MTVPLPVLAAAVDGDTPYSDQFVRMLLILTGLLVVCVLLLKLGLPWLMRRGIGRKGELIEVVEAHRLEPRKTVYLMRVGKQYYLVGSCDGRLTTLAGEPLDNDAIAGALAERKSALAQQRGQALPPEPHDDVARSNG